MVALAILSGQNIIAEAKEVPLPLARKPECVQRFLRAGREEMQGLAFGFRLEELPDCADLHERKGFFLHFFHVF